MQAAFTVHSFIHDDLAHELDLLLSLNKIIERYQKSDLELADFMVRQYECQKARIEANLLAYLREHYGLRYQLAEAA